jgi:hypothetical protein
MTPLIKEGDKDKKGIKKTKTRVSVSDMFNFNTPCFSVQFLINWNSHMAENKREHRKISCVSETCTSLTP